MLKPGGPFGAGQVVAGGATEVRERDAFAEGPATAHYQRIGPPTLGPTSLDPAAQRLEEGSLAHRSRRQLETEARARSWRPVGVTDPRARTIKRVAAPSRGLEDS